MKQRISNISLIVEDYDEAVDFYTQKLHFTLIEDTQLTERKRWVTLAPPGSDKGCLLLLARADNDLQKSRIGNQTGGRVFLFLQTDDIDRDYKKLLKNNITIIRPPQKEIYGTVVVFADLYGNLWDLIQPAE